MKRALKQKKISSVILDCWENEPNIDKELLEQAFIATPPYRWIFCRRQIGGDTHDCTVGRKMDKTDIPTQNIVPPAPVREIIDLSGAANPLQQAVWESYNPFDDDLRLRKSPETFEMQRGLYPLRREFPAYYIKGIPPTGSPILENLGFHLV